MNIYSQLKKTAPSLFRHKTTDLYYGVKKQNGKRSIENLKTTDKKLAEGRLRNWLTAIEGRGGASDSTVGQLLDKFLAVRASLTPSTITTETIIGTKFRARFDALDKGMTLHWSRVRHSHLVLWLNSVEKGEDGKPLRNSSWNRHRLFLMQLCTFAEVELKVPSPFNLKLIPAKPKQRIERFVPEESEFEKVVAEIRNPQWKEKNEGKHGGQRVLHQPDAADFAEYLGLAGVGQAEAAQLRCGNVKWDIGEVQYTRVKTGKPFSHPIYPWLEPLLRRLCEESKERNGQLFTIKDVRHSLVAAIDRLQYPNFTQRSLRAFLIRRLWQSGVNIKLIAKWQGHSDGGKLILDTYTEVFGSNDKAWEKQELAKVKWGNVVPMKEKAA